MRRGYFRIGVLAAILVVGAAPMGGMQAWAAEPSWIDLGRFPDGLANGEAYRLDPKSVRSIGLPKEKPRNTVRIGEVVDTAGVRAVWYTDCAGFVSVLTAYRPDGSIDYDSTGTAEVRGLEPFMMKTPYTEPEDRPPAAFMRAVCPK